MTSLILLKMRIPYNRDTGYSALAVNFSGLSTSPPHRSAYEKLLKIHLSALGCRLNEAELEQWATRFSAAGDTIAGTADDADVLVMNTCAVTREAVAKSRRKLQRLQRENPTAKLVVSGCYSELESPTALAELGVDLVVPNARKEQLVPMTRAAFADLSMPAAATLPAEAPLFQRNRHRAFIKIQDGCRYKCTFCIVTVARGAERSRTIEQIVSEVRALHDDGIHEVVLTGVHVGGYGSDLGSDVSGQAIGLAHLVKALLDDTDIERIRFASVEPWDLSPVFLELFANPRVQPHMHLPLQSGSDTILRRMARRCKTNEFARLTNELRERVKGFQVTTDVICGFPGESEVEWQQSLEFIATQRFAHIHVFTYSEREGTRAAGLPDSVPVPVRQARSRTLHALAKQLKADALDQAIGERCEILWERGRADQSSDGQTLWRHSGYTPNYLKCNTVSPHDISNCILPATLESRDGERLTARL